MKNKMKGQKDIRIFLVHDREPVRYGIQGMLKQEEDMKIVGNCSSIGQAPFQMKNLSPNVMLINTKMPDIESIEATCHSNQKKTPFSVIMLSTSEDYLAEALEAGVAGYLLEDIKGQELAEAIRKVYAGEIVVDGRLGLAPIALKMKSGRRPAEGDNPTPLVRETELVITPPFAEAQLLKFVHQVEQMLDASVVHQSSGSDRGIALTIQLKKSSPLADILNRLIGIAEVADIREESTVRRRFPSFTKKSVFRLRAYRRKRLLVSLKQNG